MGQFEEEYGITGDRPFRRQAPKLSTKGGPPCPSCGATGSRVIEARRHEKVVHRRRECNNPSCGRFTSYESTIDPSAVDFKLSKTDKALINSVFALFKKLAVKFGIEP
jgi:hypothetical protein